MCCLPHTVSCRGNQLFSTTRHVYRLLIQGVYCIVCLSTVALTGWPCCLCDKIYVLGYTFKETSYIMCSLCVLYQPICLYYFTHLYTVRNKFNVCFLYFIWNKWIVYFTCIYLNALYNRNLFAYDWRSGLNILYLINRFICNTSIKNMLLCILKTPKEVFIIVLWGHSFCMEASVGR